MLQAISQGSNKNNYLGSKIISKWNHRKIVSINSTIESFPEKINNKEKFESFLNKNKVSNIQNKFAHAILNYFTNNILIIPELFFEFAVEDKEIVISRKSNNGIGIIVIDAEGDIMVSFSGFKTKGSRVFFNKELFDAESIGLNFLCEQ